MKIRSFILAGLAMSMLFTACEKESLSPLADEAQLVQTDVKSGDIIPGQYIVVLKESSLKGAISDGISYDEKRQVIADRAKEIVSKTSTSSFEIGHSYAETVKGFSVKMSEKAADELALREDVKKVYPDRMFIMRPPWENPDPDPTPDGQETPYGIARVGTADGTGKTAWIIDTGIDLDHPDLNVDGSRGINLIRDKTPDDDNGHGTHCAGIVAAIDNEHGVVGVAAGATVIPVKVLDRKGSGAYSVILAGIDFVASNASAGDAANMSLGGGVYDPIDDAVEAAAAKGIYFSLAAGNESMDATNSSPARAEGANIFTISAMDSNDDWAYFSNYGAPVDYCEPGVAIYSTYKGGGYTSMSGTSMAAPHMCGILLITGGHPSSDGYVSGDPDGDADPIGVL